MKKVIQTKLNLFLLGIANLLSDEKAEIEEKAMLIAAALIVGIAILALASSLSAVFEDASSWFN